MKQIVVSVIAVIVLIVAIRMFLDTPTHGCASVKSTAMGTVMEGPNGKTRLSWDDKCPSGVAWTAK